MAILIIGLLLLSQFLMSISNVSSEKISVAKTSSSNYWTNTPLLYSNLPKPAPSVSEMWVDDDYTNVSCGGHTWGVDAFNSIQAAIYAADPSSSTTINVLAGDYYERLTIDKPVKILGEDAGEGQFVANVKGDTGDKWALICVSANDMGASDQYQDRDCFPAQGLQAYYSLKNRGYDDEHIILMLWHDDEVTSPTYDCEPGDDDDGFDEYISIYDGTNNWLYGQDGIKGNSDDPIIDVDNMNVTKTTLQQQITNLSNLVTRDDHVLLFFVNHGRKYGTPERCHIYFEDDTNGPAGQYLDSETLDLWLDQINCKRMSIMVDMCRSYNFINFSINFTKEANRLIIGASGDINNIAHAWFDATSTHFAGSWFFHPFWERIKAGDNVERAYQCAIKLSDKMAEDYSPPKAYQYPFLLDKIRDADEYSLVPYGGSTINLFNNAVKKAEISRCQISGDKGNTAIGINLENEYIPLTEALINDTKSDFYNVTSNCTDEDSIYFKFFPNNQSELNDSFMIGATSIFSRIYIKLSPGGAGAGGSFSLQCARDRDTWVNTTIQSDTTKSLSQSGDIIFAPPLEWAFQSHIHSITREKSEYGYWVRLRLMDDYVTIPEGNYIDLSYYSGGAETISKNRMVSNEYGIYLKGITTQMNNRGPISDFKIENNEINSHTKYGISVWQSNSNVIANNTCISNNWSAIHLNNSISDTIINNSCSNNGYGISVLYSSSNEVKKNFCNLNYRRGIYIRNSNDIKISKNICNSNNWSGVHTYDSSMCEIDNNTCSNNDYGISNSQSTLILLKDNTCNFNKKRGFYLSHSNSITISHNNCSSNNWSSIRLWDSNNNYITNTHCSSNNYQGIVLNSSSNNIFDNCSISPNTNFDFYLEDNSKNNVAINTTFATIYFVDTISELIIKNYLHIQVIDSMASPIMGVDLKIKDNDKIVYSTPGFGGGKSKTDEFGKVKWLLLTDRIYKGSVIANENLTIVTVKHYDYIFWDNDRNVDMSISHFEVFYPNSVPGKINLETPFNNSYLNDSSPGLRWIAGFDSNGDQLWYNIHLDEFGSDWTSLIFENNTKIGKVNWSLPNPLNDGEYQWRVRACDGYENGPWSDSWKFTIDSKPPNSEVLFPKNDKYYTTLKKINGTASDTLDGTGIIKVEITIERLTDNYYWNGTFWQPKMTWVLVSGTTEWSYNTSKIPWTSGLKYSTRSRASDFANNIEKPTKGIVFNIDMNGPKSKVEFPKNNTMFNQLDQITGKANDIGGSGISEVTICLQRTNDNHYWDGTEWVSNEDWVKALGTEQWYYNTTTVQWSTDCYYIIRSSAIDNISNIETPTHGNKFLYDNQPPVISISINDGDFFTKSTAVELSLQSNDSGSGVDQVAFSTDGITWTSWEPFKVSKSFNLPSGDGKKYVYYYVKDKVNNTAIVNDTIILDSTPPYSLSISINNGTSETNSTNVILTLKAHDALSGVHLMSFSNNGINWGSWLNYSNSTSYNLSTGDGEKTIFFRVMDLVGNVAEPIFATINLNTTSPKTNDTKEKDKAPAKESQDNIIFWVILGIIIAIILLIVGIFLFLKWKGQGDKESNQLTSDDNENEVNLQGKKSELQDQESKTEEDKFISEPIDESTKTTESIKPRNKKKM